MRQYYKKLQQISGGDNNRRHNSNNANGDQSLAFIKGSSNTHSAIHTVFNDQKYKHSQPHEQSPVQPFVLNSKDPGRTQPTTISTAPEFTCETSVSASVCVKSSDINKRPVQPIFRSRKSREQSS